VSDDSDFQPTLTQIEDYLNKTGNDITSSISEQTSDGQSIEGYTFQHGSHGLAIFGTPDEQYFKVQYSFSILNGIAQRQAISEAVEGTPDDVQEVEVAIEEEHLNTAREQVEQMLDEQDPSRINELRFRLLEMLSRSSCSCELISETQQDIYGFRTYHYIFPYEDGFAPSDLHDAVQSVINIGIPARIMLERAFGLSTTVTEGESGSELDPGAPGSRGFQ
jgi:hypothetical protein